MIHKFTSNITTFIFTSIALVIIVGSFWIYGLYTHTSRSVKENNIKSNLEYIDDITSNIANIITEETSNDIYRSLKDDKSKREKLEKNLQLLVTERYRYIYVVDKESKHSKEFRFLLDGSKNDDDKSEFEEYYNPLNFTEWDSIYKDKEPFYFNHKEIKSVWMTYLKPIVINNEVKAIIVIDFSLKDHDIIVSSLALLDNAFVATLLFAIFVFFFISLFAIIDKKRIISLEEKSQEIKQFNETLQHKIKIEVQKNRDKDQQMIEQSRLAQMGEMISMIAHQWRQPLTAINSTSAAINLKAKLNKLDNNTAQELSTKISSYTQHLSATINDFREFFKSNKEKKESSYEQIIQSVLNIVESSINNKNIQIIKEFNSNRVFNTYSNELKQVVLNLITNAEDILLEKEIENPTITIFTQDNILTVSDNAGGVPEDIMPKIFDPYFSTKTKKDGTGLGLYMSKTIIEEHCGGKLSVSNSADGAIFTIELEGNR